MVIDCHTHPVFKSKLFRSYAEDGKIDFSLRGLLNEMKAARVEAAATFASYVPEFTLTNRELFEEVKGSPNLLPVGSFDPNNPKISELKDYLSRGKLLGLKMYPGYWKYYPHEKRFEDVFDLCEKFGVPLFIHTGDTLTKTGKIKYSRPIFIDELAVDRPELVIIMCHLGLPWIEEGAEVAYKNENVMVDLSGLYIEQIVPYRSMYLRKLSEKIVYAISYIGDVKGKVLFGSDWPLASMRGVIGFVKRLPLKDEDKYLIFEENPRKLFNLRLKVLNNAKRCKS
ncbi:MAG: amidohydrolase family protein [Thermoproteota archaeon]